MKIIKFANISETREELYPKNKYGLEWNNESFNLLFVHVQILTKCSLYLASLVISILLRVARQKNPCDFKNTAFSLLISLNI